MYKVAAMNYNNVYTIFRHISDIKLYKPYQHSQRYHISIQSRHKYSSLNNTPSNAAFNDIASPYTAPFGPDHTSYNKTATTPISRPPHTNKQQTREKGGHNKRNTTLPIKYADFVINIPGKWVENKNQNMGGVLHTKLSPLHRQLSPRKLGKRGKMGLLERESSHFCNGTFLPK